MGALLQEWVEVQYQHVPDEMAVRDLARTLSYRELHSQANQLAHHLQRLGVRPGDWVGVCLAESSYVLLALLAIERLGGVYVSLELDRPWQQQALQHSCLGLLVTELAHLEQLPHFEAKVVCLGVDRPYWQRWPMTPPIQGPMGQPTRALWAAA
jgi:myxalamid-type nonribosomal peptide synthetase MxaA